MGNETTLSARVADEIPAWVAANLVAVMHKMGYIWDKAETTEESVGFSKYSHECFYHFVHFDNEAQGVFVNGYVEGPTGVLLDGSIAIGPAMLTSSSIRREVQVLDRVAYHAAQELRHDELNALADAHGMMDRCPRCEAKNGIHERNVPRIGKHERLCNRCYTEVGAAE